MRAIATFYLRQGNDLFTHHKTEEAIAAYEKAIAIDGNFASAYFQLAQALQKQDKVTEAFDAYQKALIIKPDLAIAPNFAQDFNRLGLALAKQKNYSEAITAYQQAIKLDPQYAEVYLNWGNTLSQQNNFTEAIGMYDRAIELDPNNEETYLKLGEALSQEKQWNRAIATYRQAIALDPQNPLLYHRLGKALQAKGNLQEAVAAYWQAIALDPDAGEIYNDLGEALDRQGKVPNAIAAYEKALEFNAKNADTYKNLCYAYHQQKQFRQAIAQCRQAIALNPNLGDVKFYLQEVQRGLTIHQNPNALQLPEQIPSLATDPLVKVKRSIVKIVVKSRRYSGTGTGWVVKREGSKAWIVTNRHVLANGIPKKRSKTNIEVEFYSTPGSDRVRQRRRAKMIRETEASDWLDLAVLEVSDIPQDIQPLSLSSTPLVANIPIRTIGNPITGEDWLVSEGEVSSVSDREFILSVPLAPGHSGSPILDRQNRVVGVAVKAGLFCQTKMSSQEFNNNLSLGCGLAFPVQPVIERLNRWKITKIE